MNSKMKSLEPRKLQSSVQNQIDTVLQIGGILKIDDNY